MSRKDTIKAWAPFVAFVGVIVSMMLWGQASQGPIITGGTGIIPPANGVMYHSTDMPVTVGAGDSVGLTDMVALTDSAGSVEFVDDPTADRLLSHVDGVFLVCMTTSATASGNVVWTITAQENGTQTNIWMRKSGRGTVGADQSSSASCSFVQLGLGEYLTVWLEHDSTGSQSIVLTNIALIIVRVST
jgi:hypothetical protein